MSVCKGYTIVITTVLILLEAIFVYAWVDIYWNQITTLVQVITESIVFTVLY